MRTLRRIRNRFRHPVRSAALTLRGGQVTQLARQVRRQRLTYLDLPGLVDLWDVVEEADTEQRDGIVVEAGTALGGSSVMLARARVEPRRVVLYDTFGMIPPPSEVDGPVVAERYEEIVAGRSTGISGDTYYGYQGDLRPVVRSNLESFDCDLASIDLVQGLYEETLAPSEPIAVAHIDCDWYESVAVCLERIWPVLVPGGVVIIDDYDHWEGCRRAVDEFIERTGDVQTRRASRLHLSKVT